jgi:hypothetical protein
MMAAGESKLKHLKCWDDVDTKVRAGVPIENIARWIQDDKGEYTHVKYDSVVRALYRYKRSLPATALAIPEPLHIHRKIEHLKRGVNELDELERLYLLQITRISDFVATEEKMKFPIKGIVKEIESAKGLLLEMVRIKQDLGLLDRLPVQTDLHLNVSAQTHAEFIENMDPEKRAKLATVADALMTKIRESLEGPMKALQAAETVDGGPEGDRTMDADYEVVEEA